MLNEGDPAPTTAMTGSDGQSINLAGFGVEPLVVYFYPKADTPGCTSEAKDFTELGGEFAALGANIVGVSRDTPRKLARFAEKYGLTVTLASDEDGSVTEAFGTWVEKSMYGRKYMGIERATFLFDRDGRLARSWRSVKVKGHAAEVLVATRSLV
jgi:thioredoxin-dependent peroxiredoxin